METQQRRRDGTPTRAKKKPCKYEGQLHSRIEIFTFKRIRTDKNQYI